MPGSTWLSQDDLGRSPSSMAYPPDPSESGRQHHLPHRPLDRLPPNPSPGKAGFPGPNEKYPGGKAAELSGIDRAWTISSTRERLAITDRTLDRAPNAMRDQKSGACRGSGERNGQECPLLSVGQTRMSYPTKRWEAMFILPMPRSLRCDGAKRANFIRRASSIVDSLFSSI